MESRPSNFRLLFMPADVQIKQFELSDQEELLAFLRHAYPDDPRKSDPAFWKWHYLDNPYTSLDNVPFWIVKDGKRVVGQAATILVELKVGAEIRKAVWILDFILLPEYRGQKLGKRLLQFGRETYPTMLALGYNDMSGNVLLSLDWVPLGTIDRFQRLLFPGHGLKETAAVAPLRELINTGLLAFPAAARPNKSQRKLPSKSRSRVLIPRLTICGSEHPNSFPAPSCAALLFSTGSSFVSQARSLMCWDCMRASDWSAMQFCSSESPQAEARHRRRR